MSNALEKRVAAIRRRVRAMVVVYGVAWTVACVLGVVVLLAVADRWIHFQDPGIRVMASLLVVGVLAFSAYRYLAVPLRHPLGDLDVTRPVERRFPQLGDRLSSAVAFLRQAEDDPEAGSAALRRAVIVRATAEVEDLKFADALDYRPTLRAVLAACASVAVAGVLIALDADAARIALARLANPVGSAAWPRENDLVFSQAPERMAAGETFEAEVLDRNGNLPEQVRIHYRYRGDTRRSEEVVEAMQRVGERMVARREGVSRPFEYRAEGGDDQSMPWRRLEVVEPPAVDAFRVTLHPPKYTGLTPSPSEKRIRALRGTKVGITGTVTKPLAEARLKLEDGEPISALISEDGFRFTVAADDFVIDQSGAYWFELTDQEGLSGGEGERWEIRAVRDTSPSVSIEAPAANMFVTPTAVVPVRILVKDDLAIERVEMRYSRSDRSDEGERVVSLYQGPDAVAAAGELPLPQSTSSLAGVGESRLVEHVWELAELGLPPGAQVLLSAQAFDYLPQVGQSLSPRRITIITAAELEDRLAQRQAFVLSELARVLKMQRDVRGQTRSLEIQLKEVGRLERADRDSLQSAELNQRQLAAMLTSRSDGIPVHIHALLADLASNRLDSPDMERRMRSLLAEIDRLARDPLPAIERDLTTTIKTAELEAKQPAAEGGQSPLGRPLADAGQGQDRVIEALERLVGDLSAWADARRFVGEIRQLRNEQQAIEEETRRLGTQTLTKDLKDLKSGQRAELMKLSGRQAQLARQFETTEQAMQRMAEQLAEKDPLAAETLSDAVEQARASAMAGRMRSTGRLLDENRVGQAARQQEAIAKGLDELLDILANRREHELQRLVSKLREAEKDLEQLRARQQRLRKKIDETGKLDDEQEKQRRLERLVRQQKELEKQVRRMARRLKRLQAERAARSADRAAAKLGKASEAGGQGDCEACGGGAKAAEKDLDDAQTQLAQARRKAEQDLASEQLARMEDALRSMIDRQQHVLEETQRLEVLRERQGRLTRPQALSLQDVARGQELLREETKDYQTKLSQAEVFGLALGRAADAMARAAGLLRRRDTGEATQNAESDALARLGQVLTALGSDDEEQKGDDKQGGAGGQGGQGGQGGEGLRDLAELKLLKLLQEDLNRRTQELEKQIEETERLSPAQEEEFARLSREQGELADLVLNLLEPAKDNGEADDPEVLPELDEESLLDDLLE